VTCTKQPDGGLVILVQEKPTHTVRVLLSQRGRLVAVAHLQDPDDMSGIFGYAAAQAAAAHRSTVIAQISAR
jgi:uncharacterized protein (DUF58 family)